MTRTRRFVRAKVSGVGFGFTFSISANGRSSESVSSETLHVWQTLRRALDETYADGERGLAGFGDDRRGCTAAFRRTRAGDLVVRARLGTPSDALPSRPRYRWNMWYTENVVRAESVARRLAVGVARKGTHPRGLSFGRMVYTHRCSATGRRRDVLAFQAASVLFRR